MHADQPAPLATHEEARLEVFWWVEAIYNRTRRHSSLGYLSPMEYEAMLARPLHTATQANKEADGKSGQVHSYASQPVAVSRPVTLRRVRGWLTPWVVLGRWWQSWLIAPPPAQSRLLLDRAHSGQPLHLYLPP